MARDDVAPVLARYFRILKIDQDRYVGGADMLKRMRKSERGGIPWFTFLDAEGREVVNSNGPKGNLGCPYTDEEIAAFLDILEVAAPAMTAEERDVIRKTLVAQRPKEKE
jgi:hypothetical protein